MVDRSCQATLDYEPDTEILGVWEVAQSYADLPPFVKRRLSKYPIHTLPEPLRSWVVLSLIEPGDATDSVSG